MKRVFQRLELGEVSVHLSRFNPHPHEEGVSTAIGWLPA